MVPESPVVPESLVQPPCPRHLRRPDPGQVARGDVTDQRVGEDAGRVHDPPQRRAVLPRGSHQPLSHPGLGDVSGHDAHARARAAQLVEHRLGLR